jgi:hypothetical protein
VKRAKYEEVLSRMLSTLVPSLLLASSAVLAQSKGEAKPKTRTVKDFKDKEIACFFKDIAQF